MDGLVGYAGLSCDSLEFFIGQRGTSYFCTTVGLPVCLEDLMTNKKTGEVARESLTDEELIAVAKKTCIPEESIHNMPFPVTVDMVVAAIKTADKIGREYKGYDE